MDAISISLTTPHKLFLEDMVKKGFFKTYADGIRYILQLALPKMQKEVDAFLSLLQRNDFPNIFEIIKERGFVLIPSKKKTKPLGNINYNTDNK